MPRGQRWVAGVEGEPWCGIVVTVWWGWRHGARRVGAVRIADEELWISFRGREIMYMEQAASKVQ